MQILHKRNSKCRLICRRRSTRLAQLPLLGVRARGLRWLSQRHALHARTGSQLLEAINWRLAGSIPLHVLLLTEGFRAIDSCCAPRGRHSGTRRGCHGLKSSLEPSHHGGAVDIELAASRCIPGWALARGPSRLQQGGVLTGTKRAYRYESRVVQVLSTPKACCDLHRFRFSVAEGLHRPVMR